jgi:transposase
MAIELAQCGWVRRSLEDLGHEVIVANARELQSVSGSSQKTDHRDAEQLTRLARVDPKLLHPVASGGAGHGQPPHGQ